MHTCVGSAEIECADQSRYVFTVMDRVNSELPKTVERARYEENEQDARKLAATGPAPKKLPKGVVLGKDGKP